MWRYGAPPPGGLGRADPRRLEPVSADRGVRPGGRQRRLPGGRRGAPLRGAPGHGADPGGSGPPRRRGGGCHHQHQAAPRQRGGGPGARLARDGGEAARGVGRRLPLRAATGARFPPGGQRGGELSPRPDEPAGAGAARRRRHRRATPVPAAWHGRGRRHVHHGMAPSQAGRWAAGRCRGPRYRHDGVPVRAGGGGVRAGAAARAGARQSRRRRPQRESRRRLRPLAAADAGALRGRRRGRRVRHAALRQRGSGGRISTSGSGRSRGGAPVCSTARAVAAVPSAGAGARMYGAFGGAWAATSWSFRRSTAN